MTPENINSPDLTDENRSIEINNRFWPKNCLNRQRFFISIHIKQNLIQIKKTCVRNFWRWNYINFAGSHNNSLFSHLTRIMCKILNYTFNAHKNKYYEHNIDLKWLSIIKWMWTIMIFNHKYLKWLWEQIYRLDGLTTIISDLTNR